MYKLHYYSDRRGYVTGPVFLKGNLELMSVRVSQECRLLGRPRRRLHESLNSKGIIRDHSAERHLLQTSQSRPFKACSDT